MNSLIKSGGLAALVAASMTLSGCVLVDGESVHITDMSTVEHFTGVAKVGMDLPFSKAVLVGNTIYLSGELGIDPATNELAEGGTGPQTTQIFKNIERTLGEFDADLTDVVKCSVFLGDMSKYGEMNAAYAAALPNPKPARSTFGANGLGLDAALEIECIAIKP